jgi:hypothetical protein
MPCCRDDSLISGLLCAAVVAIGAESWLAGSQRESKVERITVLVVCCSSCGGSERASCFITS